MQVTHTHKKVAISMVGCFAAVVLAVGALVPLVGYAESAKSPVKKEPIILVYHSVEPKTDKKEGKMQKHYHIYPEKFRAQMQYLKDNGYVPIPMKMYLRHLTKGTEVPNKSVVITFDDGWKNQYEYAYPILKEFGYTATFYLISKSVGSKSYVTWDEVKEMRDAGMDIQSHTKTHANLTKIPADKALEELKDSRITIESKIGRPVTMLAYPYYGHNDTVHKLVEEAGYTSARAGWTRTKNSKEVLLTLQSQEAVNATNPFVSNPDKN